MEIDMVEGHLVFVLWDYERYTTRDSEEPRLVAIFRNDYDANRAASEQNRMAHPAANLGYAYDYRVERVVLS